LEKKTSHKSSFLLSCYHAILAEPSAVTPEAVEASIKLIEAKNAQKASARMIRTVVGPVVKILKDYEGVVESLCEIPTNLSNTTYIR
jgi:hypothetical protein